MQHARHRARPLGVFGWESRFGADAEDKRGLGKSSECTTGANATDLASIGDLDGLRRLGDLGGRSNVGRLLSFASGGGHIHIVNFLLDECGANVNFVHGKQKRTAVHWAARNGHSSMIRHLAARGADLKASTIDGVNALAWAVFSGNLETCRTLLELGVDPSARNRWGCGLIHWGAANGSVEMCKWLVVACKLDFSLQNQQQHDGLAKAAWNGHRDLCEWLLARFPHSLSVARRDRAGLNAADIARCNGHSDLADFLSQHPSASSASPQNMGVWLPKEFTMYFRTQRIVASTEEWFLLQSALRKPAPVVRLEHLL